jgi:methionyl-tRNA formyltransferase
MRIVFMGTPRFAVACLNAIAEQGCHELVAVYTRPDAASRRGKKLYPSPVREAAEKLRLPVRTLKGFNDGADIDELAALAPDLIVTAAYGVILPKEVLDIPPFGCINVHASLLPRWRGAAPIQRSILAEDTVTGITVMRMDEGLDTGDICASYELDILDRNTEELTAALARLAARELPGILQRIERGSVVWRKQPEEGVTHARKVTKSETRLSPESTASENLLRVRAATRSNPAKALVCGSSVAVLRAHTVPEGVSAGQVSLEDRTLTLGCPEGCLVVDEVKPDGKRAMPSRDWILGLKDVDLTWRAS